MSDQIERRPNPPGWTTPKAPYNPYDYNDVRPPQGYPSEFKTPGREPAAFSGIPRDATEYQQLRNRMKNLSYTPRPMSELYPGQYKILRRIHTAAQFDQGVKITSGTVVVGIVTFVIFFNRWNDGFDNIFSKTYKWQLQLRSMFTELSDEQKVDLKGGKMAKYDKFIPEPMVVKDDAKLTNIELGSSNVALQRPTKRQFMQAERKLQERDLEKLSK